MEFIQGETLAQLIHSRAALPLERKLQLMDELAAGLEHAHRKGVVPPRRQAGQPDDRRGRRPADPRLRDRAPRHDRRDHAAGRGHRHLQLHGAEQLAGEVVDGRADLFAAGAVFYELLAYRRAFPGEPPAILRRIFLDNPEPLEHVCPGLDPQVIAIVNRCLAKQPNERYVDFSAFRAALAVARHQLTIQDTSAGAVGYDDLLRIRTEQIAQHLGTARQACDTSNYSVALQACQRVLLLEPQNAEARELTERARSGLERRKLVRQCLQEASTELDRGAVTAASALVNRALAIDPRSEDAATLRRTVDEAIRQRSNETQQIATRSCSDRTTRRSARVDRARRTRPTKPTATPEPRRAPHVRSSRSGTHHRSRDGASLLQTRPGMAIAAVVVVLLALFVWRAPQFVGHARRVADAPIAAPPAIAARRHACAAPSAPAPAPPAVATQNPVPPAQAQTPPCVRPMRPLGRRPGLERAPLVCPDQWQRGDTRAALDDAGVGAQTSAARQSDTRDRRRVRASGRRPVLERRAVGPRCGSRGDGEVRHATARAREAERLARSGQSSAAVRAYLDTVTIFAEAANEPKPRRPASSATTESSRRLAAAGGHEARRSDRRIRCSSRRAARVMAGQVARAHVASRSSDDRADCSAGLHAADADTSTVGRSDAFGSAARGRQRAIRRHSGQRAAYHQRLVRGDVAG
jgi:hypothetical protein